MFSRPDDLADSDVSVALSDGWGLTEPVLEYAAVGYGSHHWRVAAGDERWFATVDDLDARHRTAADTRRSTAERLAAALATAAALRRSGLDFVIAPQPTRTGNIIRPLGDRYVIALYRHVEGQSHPWSPFPGHTERLALLDRLVSIHVTDPDVSPDTRHEDYAIPGRDELEVALLRLDEPWGPGPFADMARALLRQQSLAVRSALRAYDKLVASAKLRSTASVLTHGEPHRGNTIDTVDGVVLIDWDTVLLAPRERDLWMLIGEEPGIAGEYTARTGVAVDDLLIETYRSWWDLCEISLFVADLRRPHGDSEDIRIAWQMLSALLA